MMRWLVAVLLITTACRSSGRDPTSLVIWESYKYDEHTTFVELVERYQAQHPGAPKIVVERVPFDGLLSKLITAAIANRTPDICRVDVGHIGRLAYGGIAQELDELGPEDAFAELLPIAYTSNVVTKPDRETGRVETHLYGISDQLTCPALFYNEALFAAANLEAPPTTLEELVAMGPKLRDTDRGVYALGLTNTVWWHLPFFYLHGADIMAEDNSETRLEEPGARATMKFLRELYADGVEGGAWKAGAIAPDQGFVNGKYAMVVSGPWNLTAFSSVDYGVALIPGSGSHESATSVGGTSMIVLKNSKKKQAAYDFLRHLTSREVQAFWSAKTGQLSVNQEALKATASAMTPAMQVFTEQLRFAHPRPRLPNWDQLENLLNPMFYSMLEGSLEVDEGMRRAALRVEAEVISEL